MTHPASDVASSGPGCRVKRSGDKIVNQRPRPQPAPARPSPPQPAPAAAVTAVIRQTFIDRKIVIKGANGA